MDIPKLLTVREFADVFRISNATVSNWISNKTIPTEFIVRPSGSRQGSKILINEQAIEVLMEPPPVTKEPKLYKKSTPSGRDKLINFF